jgi:hypothetical protein
MSLFVLLVLFDDCFLFILVDFLYVITVERREWSVRRFWRSRRARVWAAESCWRQVSLDACPLVLHNMHLIHCIYFFACINFDENLLRIITSPLQPLRCNRVNIINLDGSYGLACLTGMVLINLDTLIFYVPLYVVLLYKITLLC